MKRSIALLLFFVLPILVFSQDLDKNLSSYKKLSYYITDSEVIKGTINIIPFTPANIQDRVTAWFKQNNIPVTAGSENNITMPYLLIYIDPLLDVESGDVDAGYLKVELILYDRINSKDVIMYNNDESEININYNWDDTAQSYWNNLDAVIDDFITDWKKTHPQ